VRCVRPGCAGEIQGGCCNDCGMAPSPVVSTNTQVLGTGTVPPVESPPNPARSRGDGTAPTRRSRLGSGLVAIPPMPFRDPETAVMADPHIPEHRRFCAGCNRAVGRSRGDVPGLTEGFCGKCGHPFSFSAKLRRGELVAGQYDVAGPIDHGGLGWIYLARDRRVADRWVALKGVINRGDATAMAAALAERRSLAEVEHPNIVKIHNFVEHDGDGYIVMEYVDGLSLSKVLDARREANDNQPDPLPVELAIEYILEILPAVGHLHDIGLLYCDFKPSNVVPTAGALKLIDLGGVYRIDHRTGPVYGTAGYQAPEIAHTGPTIASDLFTVARTLVVLCIDFRGHRGTYRYTLPSPEDVDLFEKYDSLYRFLQRATAADPTGRFQSADEMREQLLGIQREVVAAQKRAPCPGPSTRFTLEGRGSAAAADWRTLPVPLVKPDDPGSAVAQSVGATEPEALIEMLRALPDKSTETELRLARALVEAGHLDEASALLGKIETGLSHAGARDWRVDWYRGTAALATSAPRAAQRHFEAVYDALPGELAPKLALAVAAEWTGDHATAEKQYNIVSLTDPAFTSGAFGLARCRRTLGDHAGAIAAYERVPNTSSAYVDAQIAVAKELLGGSGVVGEVGEILRAAAIVNSLELDDELRCRLSAQIFDAALNALQRDETISDPTTRVLDRQFVERDVRLGLEEAYRSMARYATTSTKRIELVDRANRIRPRSLF
jgi:serine/threonine-protein kinase PknG